MILGALFFHNYMASKRIYAEIAGQSIDDEYFMSILWRYIVAVFLLGSLVMLVVTIAIIYFEPQNYIYTMAASKKMLLNFGLLFWLFLLVLFGAYMMAVLVSLIIDRKTLFSSIKLAFQCLKSRFLHIMLFIFPLMLILNLINRFLIGSPLSILLIANAVITYLQAGFVITVIVLNYMDWRKDNKEKIDNCKSFVKQTLAAE